MFYESLGNLWQSSTRWKHRTACPYRSEHAVRRGNRDKFLSLADRRVQPCLACGGCFQSEEPRCVQDDPAFHGVLEMFAAADGILIASPVYFGSATPQLMALLDRVGYVARRHPELLRRKVGAAIVVARRAGQRIPPSPN